ncbi:hypothetical protein CEXT_382981 [Caerostris extrusa]|uniref:Uncharacterized protein n=1 Tax=Caerostris extrusa TaxID=172846 RepID=A0AAV4P923_CAEEX|nr:hypothetical protein CEXT_382981 [Caerostris extrusa]
MGTKERAKAEATDISIEERAMGNVKHSIRLLQTIMQSKLLRKVGGSFLETILHYVGDVRITVRSREGKRRLGM